MYEYVAVDAVLYKNGSRLEESEVDQSEKNWLSKPWSPPVKVQSVFDYLWICDGKKVNLPSKLPTVSAN